MHIALINSWPCLPNTAEIEYIKRFIEGAKRLGHEAYEVVTSDDIADCDPDFVIALHEFTPKLTSYFTVAAMWSPPAFYENDPYRLKSILSHDAYLIGSSQVGDYFNELEFSFGNRKPRSDFWFLPTALRTQFARYEPDHKFELIYVGVHWDGRRHNELLRLLSDANVINLYGPRGAWSEYPRSYRGEIPFDGESLPVALKRHGVCLCLHKTEHREADTPSMRLFEAAAAGCLIIADEIPFARNILGDSAFYINMKDGPKENADKIMHILQWANENPEKAAAMAARSHEILADEYSIEKIIERTINFVAEAKTSIKQDRTSSVNRQFSGHNLAKTLPLVDIIVRTGTRPLEFPERAIRSIANQSDGTYRIILVDFKSRADIAELCRTHVQQNLEITYVAAPDTELRSTSLWLGLKEVTAPYFAVLDDDDTVTPDHFPSLLSFAEKESGHSLYYTGVIRTYDEPGEYFHAPNFSGPLELLVRERSELTFMEPFDLLRLAALDNYIQSNTWIARSTCLDKQILLDPKLTVCEDVYLYLMLARRGSFKLNPAATAFWHWRKKDNSNSMTAVSKKIWEDSSSAVHRKLYHLEFYNGFTLGAMWQLIHNKQYTPAWRQTGPRPVALGERISLTGDIFLTWRRMHLNDAEPGGVWTSAREAQIMIPLSNSIRGCRLSLCFSASGKPKIETQAISISVNNIAIVDRVVQSWKSHEIEKDLQFDTPTNVIFLRVSCEYVIVPNELGIDKDTRHLGVFLSWIKIDKYENDESVEFIYTNEGHAPPASGREMVKQRSTEMEILRSEFNKRRDGEDDHRQRIKLNSQANDEIKTVSSNPQNSLLRFVKGVFR